MAVANSTMTPLPVRWRFPQEAEEEDESLEQDSLGNGEFDSLQHPGGSPAPAPPAPAAADDPTDAWAPQSILDAAPRDGRSFEMQPFAYATRDSRFDLLKQAGHAFQQHCRGRADDRRYGGGGNNNNNSYVHPAIFDQDKWEKHKQLIREYFESQQQLEETAQLTAEWNDIHNPPDWEPYRRPVLHAAAAAAAQGPADGAQLPQGGTWPEALPPIREQPGEVGDGDDEEEEEEDDEDEEEEDEDEEEEPDGRRLSPAGEARDARPGSRDSSASPASNRGGRPTLQLVGVTLDSSSSDDASVDSGHGASASGGSAGAGAAGAQGPKGSPASSSSSSSPPPSSCAASVASVASVASQGAPAPAALRSHRKELSMDSGIQGSSCDLASGDAGASSPAGSDDGADAAADLAAAAAAAALAASRRSPPCSRFTPTLDPDALLHGETFNLVEEVYVVGNPLAGRDSLKAVPLASAPAGGRASPPVAPGPGPGPGPAPAAASSVPAPAPPADACPDRSRHVVVVAIDFGTTYSGYAFCFTRDPELNIHMMRKWEGGDPGLNNQKTPTTLLLTPDEKFHSFGFAARDFFHDLEIQEAKRWLFFDKFKMALHHDQDMNRDTRVQAANGRSLPALAVFAHALRHLKEQALRELSDQAGADLRPDHIRWVVTVPAIWRQPAKQFIREAAYQAGICDPARPEGLLIALEPEAASICCRKLRLNQLVPEPRPALPPPPPPLRLSGLGGLGGDASREAAGLVLHDSPSGMRYMVVDCGGGTVDITVHELSERSGTLRELHKATGGPWGSMGVDAEFERLLGDVFGEELVAQFKAKRPASYTELMVSWEARKRSASPHRDSPLSVFPPFSFIDFFRKTKGKEIEQAVRKYGRKEVTWSSQGALRLQPSVMRELFQPTIHKILRYIQDVLDSPRVHGIQYLFLVGGFAESQLLQHEVRTAFSTRVRVVIPQGVALTTLRGAVLFGLEPGVVTVRRSKHTYGVGVLKRFQPGVHPEEKLVERDGVQWCADVLDKFVSAEQSVALGEAVVRRYTPALPAQSSILINIYCADSDEAQFTTDPGVRRCGALRLDLASSGGGYASASASGDSSDDPEAPPTRPREIHTRMVFGGTEITASALDLASGSCVHVDVDFLTM